MFVREDTLDDLLRRVFGVLLKIRNPVSATRGETREKFGVLLELTNPLARLSRTESRSVPVSAVAELLWYLSGSNRLDQIRFYIPKYQEESRNKRTVPAAYGPRVFGKRRNQIESVISKLGEKHSSRRAVVSIIEPSDILGGLKDVPCTLTWQFAIRNRSLDMMVNMRSNDAWVGLAHDVFCFTMIQELVARSLNVGLGVYKHSVGSLHLYERHRKGAQRFLDEGWQESRPMPPMPQGDPWREVAQVLDVERRVRQSRRRLVAPKALSAYWRDIVRLLILQAAKSRKDRSLAAATVKALELPEIYRPLISRQVAAAEEQPSQQVLKLEERK
jgi:thymidylate synthase